MLVLNGTAEYVKDDGYHIQGARYAFNLFSTIEDIDNAIEDIGIFMGDSGWNEIDVKRTKLVLNEQEIEDEIMREAFNYALENEFSIIVYGDPVDEQLML